VEERAAWSSSCSRNAHDKNVLVRRAQSRINQATLESEAWDWDDARGRSSISPHPWGDGEQAWKDHWTCAVGTKPGRPQRRKASELGRSIFSRLWENDFDTPELHWPACLGQQEYPHAGKPSETRGTGETRWKSNLSTSRLSRMSRDSHATA
jgi:hypothetical protein